MLIHFTKMHGLGNDFMVVDAIHQSFHPTPQQIQRLADRHFGIGFDQLLLVEPGQQGADFFYRIFNADGGEVNQCGNGARCFARFVYEKKLTTKKNIIVATRAGLLTLRLEENQHVTVNLGKPILAPAQIPFITAEQSETASYHFNVAGQVLTASIVSMGNPHCVLFVDDTAVAPVATLGTQLNAHPQFPQGVNVGFAQCLNKQRLRLRVFERGAGETLACGSGAAAAVVAGHLRGLLDKQVVVVELPGGQLTIDFTDPHQVLLTGPAVTVFEGTIDIRAC
jgi:diaminopimelate epimerase